MWTTAIIPLSLYVSRIDRSVKSILNKKSQLAKCQVYQFQNINITVCSWDWEGRFAGSGNDNAVALTRFGCEWSRRSTGHDDRQTETCEGQHAPVRNIITIIVIISLAEVNPRSKWKEGPFLTFRPWKWNRCRGPPVPNLSLGNFCVCEICDQN